MSTQPLFEHRLELGGRRTRALELEGDGPPLLLLHGSSDSADTWRLLLDRLGHAGRERRECARPLLRSVATMAHRTIAQRELRNDIARVLREAEAGTEFMVTVRGRPVARLGPPDERPARRVDVDGRTLRALLAGTPVDDTLAADIAELPGAEAPARAPWERP